MAECGSSAFFWFPLSFCIAGSLYIVEEENVYEMEGREFVDADFLLIRKMKQGEENAFDAFVRKYYRQVLNYCAYRCPDRQYAEDLTQETFVRFFKSLSDYQHKGKAKNYLYTIAGNLYRDYLKKIKEIPVEGAQLEGRLESEQHQMESLLDKFTMEWALKQLPDELEEVIVLYYFQELKLREIADILQIGLPLVKYRLRQARIRLEELLRKEDYEFGRAAAKGGGL